MSDDGVVPIHGKNYLTVARRVTDFRSKYPEWSISSELVESGDRVVIKTTISDLNGKVISTGYAEEERGSTNINKTSAVENCETSAVGRALAFMGLGGTEIASADEVANAITQQNEKQMYEKFRLHMDAVTDSFESIMVIKEGIASGDLGIAAEAWDELDKETMQALWLATSKGGVFTTKEREVIKSDEFSQYRRGVA